MRQIYEVDEGGNVTLKSAWKTALKTGSVEAPLVTADDTIADNHFFLASPRTRSWYVRYKQQNNH